MIDVVLIFVMSTGVAMELAGWLFFRRPETKFWTFANILRAESYLTRTGARLWIYGYLISMVALIPLIYRCLFIWEI
jgi:hypothetical protein